MVLDISKVILLQYAKFYKTFLFIKKEEYPFTDLYQILRTKNILGKKYLETFFFQWVNLELSKKKEKDLALKLK